MRSFAKLILIITSTVLLLVFCGSAASAVSGELKVATQKDASGSATIRIENLKSRANHEIDRRVAALNLVVTRISTFKHITDSDKASLTSSVKTEISNLTALKTKIAADVDLVTLKADVKSIVDSYRVFLLFIPKIHLLAASDRMLTITDELASLSSKLDQKIQSAKTGGKDITTLEDYLADMQTKTEDARSLATKIQTTVSPLSPDGYPGNRSTLLAGRDMLKTGHTELIEADHDAQKIIQGLKSLTTKSATSSANQ